MAQTRRAFTPEQRRRRQETGARIAARRRYIAEHPEEIELQRQARRAGQRMSPRTAARLAQARQTQTLRERRLRQGSTFTGRVEIGVNGYPPRLRDVGTVQMLPVDWEYYYREVDEGNQVAADDIIRDQIALARGLYQATSITAIEVGSLSDLTER